jgi:two-component system sensor histidine kinase PilS (NtrC family)
MEPLEKQAVRLMVYRMVVVFTFFLSSLGVQAFLGLEFYLKPFYYIIALVLSLNLLYTLLYLFIKAIRSQPLLIYLQLCGDVLCVTVLCLFTGGIVSIFTFLYHILVVIAGYLLKKRGAFIMATADSLVYGLLCVTLLYGWLDPTRLGSTFPYEAPTADSAFHSLIAHYMGFFLIAILMTIMSGRIETTREALGAMQKDFSSLRNLNEQIVSSLTWGVVTMEPTGLVTFANNSALQLLGETTPSGWNFNHKLHLLEQEPLLPFTEEDPAEREFQVHLSQEKHLEVVVAPLRSGESPPGFLALIRDQTEIVRLREQLALKDRLMATGAMAADIAHEIKNPLGSISGAAQMLQKESPENSSQKALLSIIQEESRRLTDILDNFLRYVKPPPLKKRTLDLNSLAEEIVILFKIDPDCGPGLSIELKLADAPIQVVADPDRIRQALWNLLHNARKAVSPQGRIAVSLTPGKETAILDVEDDGVGMRPTEIANYFQPFRRGFSQGSGLGLSMVYRIMEQHGGHIEVASVPGKGTRCRLLFPLEAVHG